MTSKPWGAAPPRVRHVAGCRRKTFLHPTTGTSAATGQHQGFASPHPRPFSPFGLRCGLRCALDPAPTLERGSRRAMEASRGVFEWKEGSRGRGIPQRAAAREDMPRKPLDAPWNDRRSGKGCRKVFLLHPCPWRTRGVGQRPRFLSQKTARRAALPPSRGLVGWFGFGCVFGFFFGLRKRTKKRKIKKTYIL